MRSYVCLIFIALAYTTEGAPSTLIVGGKNATIGKYPYQVSVKVNGIHTCGGSIIGRKTVLTAAKCFHSAEYPWDMVQVLAGTNFLDTIEPVYSVSDVCINDASFDIAVVKLEEPLEYNVLIQPIDLKTSDQDLDDESCILTGWGRTQIDDFRFSNNLREIDLKVYPQDLCYQQWNLTNNYICTFTKAGEGACDGDLGGPLVANGVQIGVYSQGVRCAVGFPDVYIRVSKFISWISRLMEIEDII